MATRDRDGEPGDGGGDHRDGGDRDRGGDLGERDDGGGRDDAVLLAARRERVWAAMDHEGLDALVLGRGDDVAYATGAASLWTAGTRPFGPACVLIAAGRSIHVLSSWDAGLPSDIGIEDCYGITWNPAVMGRALGSIPGLGSARRLGVDALSPGFARAAGRLAPEATVVPVDGVLRSVRRRKLDAEVDRLRDATAVARSGVEAARAALVGGATTAGARAAMVETVARRGRVVPSSAPMVRRIPAEGESVVTDGDAVVVDAGVLVEGYEGGCGRTLAVGSAPAGDTDRARAVTEHLVDACRPGVVPADLGAAAAGAASWLVRGTGMGFEPPVLGDRAPEPTAADGGGPLEAGMVLSVEATVEGARHREVVVVGDGGPRVF